MIVTPALTICSPSLISTSSLRGGLMTRPPPIRSQDTSSGMMQEPITSQASFTMELRETPTTFLLWMLNILIITNLLRFIFIFNTR